jgi:Trk K+ transport system NAD-binding subunit
VAQSEIQSTSAESKASLLIVVGASETGRRVASRLGRNWRIRLIDSDAQASSKGDVADGGQPSNVEILQGDGTSRLVLGRAGADEAAALIAATGDDQANVEIARLARETFRVRRVLAISHRPAAAAELEALGAEPIDAPSAIAAILIGRLEPTIRPAVGVGLSQGEIVEVTLLGSSPVIGRPLRLLGAREWLVAAVYRDERLLIPHGDTVLQSGDRVVLVGAPSVVPGIAEFFRAGRLIFPLPYGRRLGVVALGDLSSRFWDEVDYLRSSVKAAGVDVFSQEQPVRENGYLWHVRPGEDVLEAGLTYPGVGCVILPPEKAVRIPILRLRKSAVWTALARARQPVLVARGSFPYQRMALAALENAVTKTTAEVAVGLADLLGASLSGVTATPPAFVVGPRAVSQQLDALSEIAVIAQVQRVPLSEHHLFGNPVRRILQHADQTADLLIVGHRTVPPWAFWRVDVPGELVVGARCSSLVVPAPESR